jgi:hypothetical protein
VLAIALGEPAGTALARRLRGFERLLASNLLEAEVRAALARERVATPAELFDGIGWILPDRPLTDEMVRALAAGPLRGADLWHLASALYVAPQPAALTFLTLDTRQRTAARALGFRV